MSDFMIAFVVLAAVLGAFAYLAMPSAGRLRRAIVSSSFALVLAFLFFGYSDMLGRPKAARLELFRTDMTNAEVISAVFKEGDGIFLWLRLPTAAEPRYYKLPWDEKVAKSLQEAIQQNTEQHGGGVGMNMPFEHSWDRDEPKFYALPQPKFPDKPGERAPVTVYQAPEQGV
jgi:hypothetical protein